MNFKFKLSRRLAGIHAAPVLALALGACAGGDLPGLFPDDTTDINAARVAAVSLAPDTATLAVGETRQFTATVTDTRGNVVQRNVEWSSLQPLIASVTSSGLVRGNAPGLARILATSRDRSDTAFVSVQPVAGDSTVTPPPDTTVTPPDTTVAPPPDTTTHAGWYVAPNGASINAGTRTSPWSLAAALSGASGRIAAGDTVWLLGGTYSGTFRGAVSGSVGLPVVLRQYPGERATVDGTIRVDGHDLVLWGFEIMRSAPTGELPALEMRGARQKVINMVIHDAAQQGITFWDEAIDSELYGNIVYNNGTHENLDHGTYVHNMSGTKLIQDNVFFNNLAYGIHVYANPTDPMQRNVHVVGNVSFNNGTISTRVLAKCNILIGAETPGEGMRAINNLTYFSGSAGLNVRVGYLAANNDIVVAGNMIYGGATGLRVDDWASATVQDNTIGGPSVVVDLADLPTGHLWSGNRYFRSATASAWVNRGTALTLAAWQLATGLGATDGVLASTPTTTQVFVKNNRYEPGRALIVVYNFGQLGSVNVDLTGILPVGRRFELRNVQDFFGVPVVSGTYGGGTITVPMTGVAPPPRLGRTTPAPPKTGPAYDAFVVVPMP